MTEADKSNKNTNPYYQISESDHQEESKSSAGT
jgi:hypothetical protein